MYSHLLLSVISDDKPGVVEAIAEVVAFHGGNWLESRLSQLAGKFAGVIRVSIAEENEADLAKDLDALSQRGIWLKSENIAAAKPASDPLNTVYLHALGPDRPGIVRELSRAFANNQVNLANLETALSSMPYSGDPLFEASGQLEIPKGFDIHELQDTLNTIADQLALDISLSDQPFE